MLRRDGFALAEERYGNANVRCFLSPYVLTAISGTESYKPTLLEVERILAESGLDRDEMARAGGTSGGQGHVTGRNRR
jgi:hypothetical protein